MTGDLNTGLAFGIICLLFASAAGFLLFQVVEMNLDVRSACIIYAPLLACWIGIRATMGGPLAPVAWGLGILSIAWCVIVPLRKIAVFQRIEHDLSDDRIQALRASLMKQPGIGDTHFKLAELYENRGWLREAYQEYASALSLDRQNVRARIRTRELYQKITGRPLPADALPPETAPGPEIERPRAAGNYPAAAPASPPPAFYSSSIPDAAVIPEATTIPGSSSPDSGISNLSPATGPLAELADAAARYPNNAKLHEQMAEELLRLGRPHEAAECYRKALAIEPQNERFRFNLFSLLDAQSESTTLVSAAATPRDGTVSEDAASPAAAAAATPAKPETDADSPAG